MTRMASETLTLHDYLRRPNPAVKRDNSWTGTNTRSGSSTNTKPSKIVEWKDFNYNSLQALYGRILKREVHSQDLPDFSLHLPFHLREIQDEDSLEALLIRWNNAVVSCALSVAQRSNGLISTDTAGHRAGEIFMARGGHAFIQGTRTQKELRPDWAGIIPSNGYHRRSNERRKSYLNVLPGDSKLSTKWSSTRDPNSLEFKKPFFQIYNYCQLAQVRYGYLLTPEELVGVRVSKTESEEVPGPIMPPQRPKRGGTTEWKKAQKQNLLPKKTKRQKHGILEYKSIPWVDAGQRGEASLSINLALWWLHMMAATACSIAPVYHDLLKEYYTLDKSPIDSSEGSRNLPSDPRYHAVTKSRKRRRDDENDTHYRSVRDDNVRPSQTLASSFSDAMQTD